jgi:dihydropteroate synthase
VTADRSYTPSMSWRVGTNRTLSLDEPRLMGVLNVTPDSFSDGGELPSAADAVERALELVEQGAAMVDVGGESTRPGARRVGAAEQIERTVPVIAALRDRSDVLISIDTTAGDVAAAALEAGADVINDVSAGTDDPGILDLAARTGCGLVLMHRRVPPDADRYSDEYDRPPDDGDVVETVRGFLVERCNAAIDAGVAAGAIVIDPGLGFGKTVEQNYELIRRAPELIETGFPVLSAASRKSFVGAVAAVPEPRRRVAGSVAVSVIHWSLGVRLFRVHDVAAHREALAVAAAVHAGSGGWIGPQRVLG